MKRKILRLFVLSAWLAVALNLQSQVPVVNEADTSLVNELLQKSKEILNESPDKAIALATQAKDLAEKADFLKGKASALKYIGLGYYYQGKYIETLDYWNQSLKIFERLNDQIGVANLLNNIGAIYTDRGDDAKGLEYSLKSLEISEKTEDKLRILSALNSVGTIYYSKSEGAIGEAKKINQEKALKYLLMALPLCEELGDNNYLGIISENIAEIYFDKNDDAQALSFFNKSIKALGNTANSSFAYNGLGKLYLRKGDFNKALRYHEKAYAIADNTNNQLHMVRSLEGIANVYVKRQDFKQALSYYHKAEAQALEIHSNPNLKDIYEGMSMAYGKAGDYANAYAYQNRLANIKDTLFNEMTQKKLGVLQFEFDLQKKQGEITMLTADKALKDAELKRQKFAKNALLGGIALVLIIALIIYRDYKAKIRINKILDRQKEQIEQLLLNILPAEVATELQIKGHATPRYYETVSVMFTDFKGFTAIADKVPPRELVEELNICFVAFDEIIHKYNLEKIKTIGDAYMCAGGIPTFDANHVYNIVKAGTEIQKYIYQNNKRREEKGLPPWEIRIGIHVGPIVAGVVGKKKYAYDIWGSTVNVASRMESNGEPGLVNISADTYELIKDKFSCKYRGKVYAKNIGEIDMYFVDSGHEILDDSPKAFLQNEVARDNIIVEKEIEKFDLDSTYG
jgi:adenylate cyclase